MVGVLSLRWRNACPISRYTTRESCSVGRLSPTAMPAIGCGRGSCHAFARVLRASFLLLGKLCRCRASVASVAFLFSPEASCRAAVGSCRAAVYIQCPCTCTSTSKRDAFSLAPIYHLSAKYNIAQGLGRPLKLFWSYHRHAKAASRVAAQTRYSCGNTTPDSVLVSVCGVVGYLLAKCNTSRVSRG